MTLSGNIAIVTGGTGALGSAVVKALLEAGAIVALPYRSDGALDELRTQENIAPGAPLSGAAVDLTDPDGVRAFYDRVAQDHGGIDIVINAAGGFGGGDPVHKTSWDLWQQQLDINLKTTVLSCQAAIPHLIERGGGSIVNVSTRTATQPGANLAAYAAVKRAVLQLTDALAAELRAQDITVNAVLPSVIDTPANRKSNPNANYSAWAKPGAIARVILFLVGPDARIISGAHVPVYGKA